jgi:hypothetical protein
MNHARSSSDSGTPARRPGPLARPALAAAVLAGTGALLSATGPPGPGEPPPEARAAQGTVTPADPQAAILAARAQRRVASRSVRAARPSTTGSATRAAVDSVRVPAPTVRRRSSRLAAGTTRTVSPGRPGRKEIRYAETWANGRPATRRVVGVEVVRHPEPRVLLVGTRPPAPPRVHTARAVRPRSPSAPASRSGQLNWAALARCESGGNPRTVAAGRYHGLYQFSVGAWRAVGGTGLPSEASPAEQTRRARTLYARAGRAPWPTCGRLL